MLFTNKKRIGFSFTEILMATVALSILMLGFAGFTSNVFDVSASHANQIKTVNQARFSTERVITQINKAAYIYPANISLTLAGKNINTSNSVAMLVPEDNGEYRLVSYYLQDNAKGSSDLLEFFSDDTYEWTENTCPADNIINALGSSSILADDIDKNNTTLEYILNYQNAPTDKILKGEMSNYVATNKYALIKGVYWKIYQGTTQNEVIQLKGTSENVPRFFE
jgi:hypothetical protein